MSVDVGWHDVECGSYVADLSLWLELAGAAGGPVLDVGAGTGRVALVLAAHGADVTALDVDPELLAELAARAREAGLQVETVVADATGFDLAGRDFALIAVPMQTIQLLPERAGFFASARRALAPGGLVALALAEATEPFAASEGEMPAPDVGEWRGAQLISQPLAIRLRPGVMRIERLREAIAPDGTRTAAENAIELALVTREQLAAEAAPHGLHPEPSVHIAPTDDHVGSEVVMLRG